MTGPTKKDSFIERLETAIDVEYTIGSCCSRLAALIRNGRIRGKFRSMSAAAKVDEGLLSERLMAMGVRDFALRDKCTYCKINPDSFSTTGAIDLALELAAIAVKLYKDLLGLSDNAEDRRIFKRLLKEKTGQRNFLKKERRFPRKDADSQDLIATYCIPEVISQIRS